MPTPKARKACPTVERASATLEATPQPEYRPQVAAIEMGDFAYPDLYPTAQLVSGSTGDYLNPELAEAALGLLAQFTGGSIGNMRVFEALSVGGEKATNSAVAVLAQPDGNDLFIWWADQDGKIGY